MSAVNNSQPSIKNVSFDTRVEVGNIATAGVANKQKSTLARTTSSLFRNAVGKKNEIAKPINNESVKHEATIDKVSKSKIKSLFRSKSKLTTPQAASSSDSMTASSSKAGSIVLPTSAKLTNTDKYMTQIRELKESILAFKKDLTNTNSNDIGVRLEAKIIEKENSLVALKEAVIHAGASKAKQIGDFIGLLDHVEVENLGLEELQVLKENLDSAIELNKNRFETQTEFLDAVEEFQRNPNNASALATFCLEKSALGDERFFHKDLEGGTGKVTSIGYKNSGIEEKLFVFKPISGAPGSPTFKNKFQLPSETHIRNEINTLISSYKEEKQNFKINNETFNLVEMLSDSGLNNNAEFRGKYSFTDLSSFKADFKLEHLSNEDAQKVFSNMVGLFKYRYDVTGGIHEVNLMEKAHPVPKGQDELTDQSMNILTEKIKIGAEAELAKKTENLKSFEIERPIFYGGVRQVEVNHVVRSELEVLKSSQPISTLSYLDNSEGEGVLIEFCKNSGDLEGLAKQDPDIAREMLEGATDEVKTLILNQYVMDVLFGSTDNNIGNALVTLKNDPHVPFENNGNQIVGIVFIDLGLCMPKTGSDKTLGDLQSGVPLYQGCSFMNERGGMGFLKERVTDIKNQFPQILEEITSRYASHGVNLTSFQKNTMTARLEVLNIALNNVVPQHRVSEFIASPEFFNLVDSSVNKKGEIVIAKLISNISKSSLIKPNE